MTEKIIRLNQTSIDIPRLECAFGSIDFARSIVAEFQKFIFDPQGLILQHGSFVLGICSNPNQPYYSLPIDYGRISDIDLAIIDSFLFQNLPEREIINDLEKSYPFTYTDGRIKNYLKRGERFKRLFNLVDILQESTGRLADINVYKNIDSFLMLHSGKFSLLAKKDSICF